MNANLGAIAFAFLIGLPLQASAETDQFDNTGRHAGTYICNTRAAAGIQHIENGQWAGNKFRNPPGFQMVISVIDPARVDDERTRKSSILQNQLFYRVSIRDIDGKYEQYSDSCATMRYENQSPLFSNLVEDKTSILHCLHHLLQYKFDLDNRRYMRVYMEGYINGVDDRANTPSIDVGSCRKQQN